jgi:hypothetical protein
MILHHYYRPDGKVQFTDCGGAVYMLMSGSTDADRNVRLLQAFHQLGEGVLSGRVPNYKAREMTLEEWFTFMHSERITGCFIMNGRWEPTIEEV